MNATIRTGVVAATGLVAAGTAWAGTKMVEDAGPAGRTTATVLYGVIGLLNLGDGIRHIGSPRWGGLYGPMSAAAGAGLLAGSILAR